LKYRLDLVVDGLLNGRDTRVQRERCETPLA
jgi:hypothetical protein